MSITDDLVLIARQEAELVLPKFDFEDAWVLGVITRELAGGHPVVVDIRRFGQPPQPLFYAALHGTTPDNPRWVARKSNTVARFHRSSYAVGLALEKAGAKLAEKYSLPDADYSAHGGSVPLHVHGVGIIGALTVSGLPQREDHNLAIEGLCKLLGREFGPLRMP